MDKIVFPELDTNTIAIVNACKQVLQSYEDYETDTMTTPITVVDACEQLNCVLERIKREHRQASQMAADNAMTEGFEHSIKAE